MRLPCSGLVRWWRRDHQRGRRLVIGGDGRDDGALRGSWLGLPDEGHGAGAEAVVDPEGGVGHGGVAGAIPQRQDPRAQQLSAFVLTRAHRQL